MGKIADLSLLNPIYEYLPYCAVFREEIDPVTHKKAVVTEFVKTYPAFPWLPETGNHINEDPITFMELCAKEGLVKWETVEERELRLRSEHV